MAANSGMQSETELLLAAAATLQTWKKISSSDTEKTISVVLESAERLRHNTLDVVQSHSTVLEAAAECDLVPLDRLISAVGQSVSYAKHPSCVLHLLGRLMMKSIHADSITDVLTKVFVDILSAQPKLGPLVISQVRLMLQELPPVEHPALVQVLAPLVQSMAVTSIVVTTECLTDMCSMFIQQIHRYNTSLNSEGHLKNAVASVSSLVQVYLHLNAVNNDEALLAAASLCMDLFRTHMCLPMRLTDDSSSCHCLDLALSHVCELTTRGLSVGYHLSMLKQHISGLSRTALQSRHFIAISWLLCKHLLVPHSVQLLLSIVSTLLQSMMTSQKIACQKFVLLPLLQVASLPEVCCIGCVSKENVRMVAEMLGKDLTWSHDACGFLEPAISPLVSTPVYKDIVAAANLSNLFCRSSEALLEWIRVLVDSLKPATERALLQSIVLLQYFPELISSNHAREAFKALSSLAKDTRLGYLFLPAVIFCFPLLQDDLEKGHFLTVLPDVVRSNKAGLGQVVALILEMSKNAKLMPTMIRILHSVWEHHDVVYPHLHDLLIAPLPVGTSVASVVNILLSKALTTKEMCELRSEVHGTELLGIIAAYFDERTLPVTLSPAAHAMLLNVALSGLRALIEAEVVDKAAAFRNLVLKQLEDRRPLVQAGVCAFLEVLMSTTLDPAVSTIVFPALWKFSLSEEVPVSSAAWLTLSACDLDDLLLSDIPDMVRLVMGIDAACSDDSMVNGKQVLSLLPSVCLGAVEAFLCLLIKFLKQELKNMPKGVISSAVRKAKMSSGYKGLNDILTALRNTSLPGLPSGLQLLVLEQHHQPSSDSRGKKQMMGTALQRSKSALIDLLSKELYPSSMVLDQFVEIHQCIVPEEWDRFVRMVYRQFVEFAKMSKFQDEFSLHAMARQDLIRLIIDAHRVSRLKEDNVLCTLVSLACLCDFDTKASTTQPSLAAFESQRFVHDVLLILTALATGVLQDSSLGTWSSMIIMEVFAGWTCPAHALVAAISFVLRSVLSQSEGITKLVVFEDTVVRFLTSAIHTFKLGIGHEEMEQTAWLLGSSLNGIFSTTYGVLPQVSSVLTELLKNILMSGTTSSLVLASLIPSMLMVEWSTEAVLLLFKQLLQDCTTTIPTPIKAVALGNALCTMYQVNILPEQLLLDYFETMSRLPLSQQYAPLHLMFGSTLHWLSTFGCSAANRKLTLCVPVWITALQNPASRVCCCMALAGSLGVHTPHREYQTVPRPTAEMKETVLPPLLLALQQFLTSDDTPLRGTMIWLMVKVVLIIQESESDTSDLVPLGLLYLPETQAFPAIFEFLKEEASVAVAGNANLDVAEKVLSSLVVVDGVPPADWSSILLVLYHKGGPLLQSRCLEFAFKYPSCGSLKFIQHSMVSQNFSRLSNNALDVIVQALSLPNFPVDGRFLWQLLYALCQMFHRGSVDLAQSVCEALLNHYKSAGNSQYSRDCHARIAHTLVSVVMESAVSLGVKNTPVNSAGVLHLLSQYLSTVLPNSLLQLLHCTSEENKEVKAVKCMLLAESTQFVKTMQWRKHVTSICDVSPVADITFARGIICLAKCVPNLISEEENVHVLIKLLLPYVSGAEGNRKRLLVWMIVHILSCTHKYDRSIDCMAVAGDLLFKEGLPSDVWEECLSASLYCAPTNASIDKNCMESVIKLCSALISEEKAVALNIVSAVVSSMSRQQRKASALLTFID